MLALAVVISCIQRGEVGTASTYRPGPLQGAEPWGSITLTGVPAGVDRSVSIGVEVVSDGMPTDLQIEEVRLIGAPDWIAPGRRICLHRARRELHLRWVLTLVPA
jgi:hypothetical protein